MVALPRSWIHLEDYTPLLGQDPIRDRLVRIAAGRTALAPNFASFVSIDEKLERPLGSVEWSIQAAEARLSRWTSERDSLPFLEWAREQEGADVADRVMYAEARLDQLDENLEPALQGFRISVVSAQLAPNRSSESSNARFPWGNQSPARC